MKSSYLQICFFIIGLISSSLASAEPMCGWQQINLIQCHSYWLSSGIFFSIPILLLIVAAHVVIGRRKLLMQNKSKLLLTYSTIVFTIIFSYIENIAVAELTIYDSYLVLFGDIILLPLVFSSLFYFSLFNYIKKRERNIS